MMKALTHNIQQEREDQRDRSAQLFMWCIVVSMHQDDGIGASRLLRACNEMDAFEKKYQTAILYGSSKNATDAMRENLKGICDFEVRLPVDRAPRGRREEQLRMASNQGAKSRKDIPGSRSSICRAIWRTVMKPINAEETVRVFNGWLEEADSLAEREAIERCIDHIQDAPAVSQQELRSYMLPWFSPFAAPWCGKIQRAFPKAYVTMNFELILVPRTNTYINLNHCSTPDEFKAEVIEGVSRFAFKAFTKPLCKEHLDGINKLLDTKFTPEDMEYIYTNLGNGINHELCMKFVKSGYDLKVIEESV